MVVVVYIVVPVVVVVDALCLRYGWLPSRLADSCPCGKRFTIDHALACSTGRYPTIRRNEVRDLLASLLSDVCHDIEVEPKLQPLSCYVGGNSHTKVRMMLRSVTS